jgi:hypothetical protein
MPTRVRLVCSEDARLGFEMMICEHMFAHGEPGAEKNLAMFMGAIRWCLLVTKVE